MKAGKNRVLLAFFTLLAGVLAAALFGCQAQRQTPATGSAPPAATEAAPPAATEAAVGGTQPVTLTWDQQLSCVQFSQGRITIKVGDKIRFNSSVQQVVTLRIPVAVFGANDTTLTIPINGSVTTGVAQTPGSYDVSSTPAMCATPQGGVGPVIVVEESK